jgi:hypothetical protein
MPHKYLKRKWISVRKQKHKVSNWSEYNNFLKNRGDIEFWISDDVIAGWYETDRIYDGTGAPRLYTELAIITCHEIRKVFKQPLRQCQGFINSVFRMKGLPIVCPDYTVLSKRLGKLKIKKPRYRKTDRPDDDLAAIAIDSSGLKRFGRDEWHQEKHKVLAKRSWRKLHIAVDEDHFIQGCELTDRFVADESVVDDLFEQINIPVGHITADGAYDKNPVYNKLSGFFPDADIVIPPAKNATRHAKSHRLRNRNIKEIALNGQMEWQRMRRYGQRNYSELAIQRYKRILGNSMQARDFKNQKQEAMIGCGVLNKITSLGMPESFRVA